MKDKIKDYLLNRLSYAYCDNCGTTDCDVCHRKYQNWSLSKQVAEKMAENILDMIEKEKTTE